MTIGVTNEHLEQQLAWRYATKYFDPAKKISARDWASLEASLLLAPSSFGLQPWRFITISDPALRAKLRAHSWNQSQVVDASHYVVFAARTTFDLSLVDEALQHTAEVREVALSTLEGGRSTISNFITALNDRNAIEPWCTHQLYLALGMLLTSAALLQIDACPLEGIDPNFYNEILDLPRRGFSAKVACALGYRSDRDLGATLKKVRRSAQDIIERR